MVLKTGMLVGIIGTDEMGVLIQIRQASNTCVIKLNNGTLKKNVPLDDVEEARDMTDTKKESTSPIRLTAPTSPPTAASPAKSPLRPISPKKEMFASKSMFQVGDQIKARYKNGSKFFNGRIMKSHSDGTYDIKYDDGDAETRVAEALIELVGRRDKEDDQDDDSKTTLKLIKKSFRMDQAVRARYKKGKKFFAGKIKKVHSDNTYDIRYDDGDTEMRVDAEYIEAAFDNEEQEKGEQTRPTSLSSSAKKSSTKHTSKTFAVGDTVKARYKKGKKLFAGKIIKARTDGTYDIRYDDGDVEMHVEASMVEALVDAEEEEEHDKGKISKQQQFRLGDIVQARYKGGTKLFSGKIIRKRIDGTYDIEYDDGDVEMRVKASLIEAASNENAVGSSPHKKKEKTKTFEVGDVVKARYKKGTRLFSGKITRVRTDGTYDIKYDDGDVETHVETSMIEANSTNGGETDRSISEMNKMARKIFQVGDSVKARFQKSVKWFPGKITRVRTDGTFDIQYKDGDVETHVERDMIQKADEDMQLEQKISNRELSVGDQVKVRYKGGKKLFSGTITRVRRDGTYDIKYDDGDVEQNVEKDLIEVLPQHDDVLTSTIKNSQFEVGDKVRARYKKGAKFFNGKIIKTRKDGTFDIQYDDGEKESYVEARYIEAISSLSPKKSPMNRETSITKKLSVGDRVHAHYKKGKKLFPGKVMRVHSDGTYDIKYDDGDVEMRVERTQIEGDDHKEAAKEGKESPKKCIKQLAIGDAVKARYKRGAKMFPGKITRVRMDGTYDIEYDDGDVELSVEKDMIEAIVSVNEEKVKESEQKKKGREYEIGDIVNARYKNGKKLSRGKISRVRTNGTYDIKYDNGETETHVESSRIEPEDGEESGSSKKKQEGKLAMGDEVKARYKAGTKWFPGKIIKVRLDGTFDIRYEDGDEETRVKAELIERVDSTKKKETNKGKTSDDDDLFADSDDNRSRKKNSQQKLVVGDIVDANYKQKGKFHRGKIVRVRSNNTYDVEYVVGDLEQRVDSENIKKVTKTTNSGSDDDDQPSVKKILKKSKHSSGSESESTLTKDKQDDEEKESSGSSTEYRRRGRSRSLQKGMRVTFKRAHDAKTRRIGTIRSVHSDGSCDLKYDDGELMQRIDMKLLLVCSDLEDSDEVSDSKVKKNSKGKAPGHPAFGAKEKVLACWRRASKLSRPRHTSKWEEATVLTSNSDGTYTIRYGNGDIEEDTPIDALRAVKRKHSTTAASSSEGENNFKRKSTRKRRMRSHSIRNESLFLLEQLAMTLFEEGVMKKKPKLLFSEGESDSDSNSTSEASRSSESDTKGSYRGRKRDQFEVILSKLFDAKLLRKYHELFAEHDNKSTGKISQRKLIAIIVEINSSSSKSKEKHNRSTPKETDTNGFNADLVLTEWFATHDDLRTHRRFDFKTFMLALAYAKYCQGKQRMEQTVATVLEGRFASYHEHKRQLELWQQKLGFRLFETLQRCFHDRAIPSMIPARVRVSELGIIFHQVARNSVPNKPLEVYLLQLQLHPHQTLLLPEMMCCYYQLYGSGDSQQFHAVEATLELRPVAFVASCLFSNGDIVCQHHGDLVRRLCVGRTPAQQDLILRYREVFESLLSSDDSETTVIASSQLAIFAAKVVQDPCMLEPAIAALRKRSAMVSLIEIYASCGFVIDELTSAPTITNAIDKLRLRVESTDVRRIIGLVRTMCLKVLRFPNNADYWRIRADSSAFQQKLGRFDGATSLLEAVGFVEYNKTHFELRGARNAEGKRVSSLSKATLDNLRDKCVQLDAELSLVDGVESISSILQRVAKEREQAGQSLHLDELQQVLQHLAMYITNVLKNPKDSRCWRIRESNKTYQKQIGYLPFSCDLMESIGFQMVETSQGNVFAVRGTGTLLQESSSSPSRSGSKANASLTNFTFSRVSDQTEWFLWRKKQEIDRLLQDDMQYVQDLISETTLSKNTCVRSPSYHDRPSNHHVNSLSRPEALLVKMYPYGKSAIDIFNKTAVQRQQLDMIKKVFETLDIDQRGYLVEKDLDIDPNPPQWMQFGAFDSDKDGCVDLADFVAAFGPLVDHPFDNNLINAVPLEEAELTLCELVSLAVGRLRISASLLEIISALNSLASLLYRIIQDPMKSELWVITSKSSVTSKLLRFPAGRKLFQLAGFRDVRAVTAMADGTANFDKDTVQFELVPQKVRFKTSKVDPETLPQALDTITITRLQTIAAMLGGHCRGLKFPQISDVSAVARAIALVTDVSKWIGLVELALLCISNILSHPTEERYRQLNTSTKTYTNIVAGVVGGPELLLSLGFRETDSSTLVLLSDITPVFLEARKLELESALNLLRARRDTKHRSEVLEGGLCISSRLRDRDEQHEVDYYRKKALVAELARQEEMKKTKRLEQQLQLMSEQSLGRRPMKHQQHRQIQKRTETRRPTTAPNTKEMHQQQRLTQPQAAHQSDWIERETRSVLSPQSTLQLHVSQTTKRGCGRGKMRPASSPIDISAASKRQQPKANERNTQRMASTTV